MRYGFIIEWIDTELERLQAARKVLAGTESFKPQTSRQSTETPKPERRTRPKMPAARPVLPLSQVVAANASLPAKRVVIHLGRPGVPSALTAKIPLGPVAISPAQLKPRPALSISGKTGVGQQTPWQEGTLESLVRDLESRRANA